MATPKASLLPCPFCGGTDIQKLRFSTTCHACGARCTNDNWNQRVHGHGKMVPVELVAAVEAAFDHPGPFRSHDEWLDHVLTAIRVAPEGAI